MKLKSFLFPLATCATMLMATAATVNAQCNPGEQIEYKAQNWPEKWEVGTCLREVPGGKQVLVAEKPNQFYPEGFHRAYSLDQVRPVQKAPEQPAQNANPAQPDRPNNAQPVDRPMTALPQDTGGGAPMSEAAVLSFLRQRLGDGDPFMNPKREQVLQQLREEVLRRGVNFRHHAIGKFADELGKFGALSNVTAALGKNYGPPAKLDFLFGRWDIAKIGGTTAITKGGQDYRRQEMAGLAGSLTVNAGGTYSWDSPSGVFKGQWRKATAEEMGKSDTGGDGVVLLQAKSGADWIVFRRTDEGLQGKDGVRISDNIYRGTTEYATRH